MPPITTIVHFSMPKENMEEFLGTWEKAKVIMLRQPGALDGVMHSAMDQDSPFQFINVARWESAVDLANALKAVAIELKAVGIDFIDEMNRLGARVSQNNYAQEAKY
jgi:hypothetical protein